MKIEHWMDGKHIQKLESHSAQGYWRIEIMNPGQIQGYGTRASCRLPKVALEEQTETFNTSSENYGVQGKGILALTKKLVTMLGKILCPFSNMVQVALWQLSWYEVQMPFTSLRLGSWFARN